MNSGDQLLADWLTEQELAAQLKHHERTLARWRNLGIGPRYSRNGRQYIYYKHDVGSWLRAGGIDAATKPQRSKRAR